MSLSRRAFVTVLTGGGVLTVVSALEAPRALGGQRAGPSPSAGEGRANGQAAGSNLFAMDQDAARTVRRPAKPGAVASLTADQRDELEHQIRCQCGCTLDVYTCRTTDFSCQVSPAMHRDILALVSGGYTGSEILDAFVGAYGERALMAPRKDGFNAIGWLAPFAALAAGGVVISVLIRQWSARAASAARPSPPPTPLTPTAEELRRLQDAVRDDSDS